jgi:hypothetical protein
MLLLIIKNKDGVNNIKQIKSPLIFAKNPMTKKKTKGSYFIETAIAIPVFISFTLVSIDIGIGVIDEIGVRKDVMIFANDVASCNLTAALPCTGTAISGCNERKRLLEKFKTAYHPDTGDSTNLYNIRVEIIPSSLTSVIKMDTTIPSRNYLRFLGIDDSSDVQQLGSVTTVCNAQCDSVGLCDGQAHVYE